MGESLQNAKKIMWVGTGQFIKNSYKNFGVGIAHPGPPIDLPVLVCVRLRCAWHKMPQQRTDIGVGT